MPIYLQHGNLIDYVPPTDTSTEDVVFMGGLVGIPQTFIPAGELGALSVDGVYMFTKKDGVSVNLGEVVKYCGTTKLAQDSNADLTLGVAVADAEADSLGVKVKINSVLPTEGGGGGSGDIEIAVNCGLAFGEQGELFVNINTNGGLAFNSNGELIATGGGGGGGLQNLATGEGSLSILGYATTSDYSTSVGADAEATGCGSTAIGKYTAAYGDYSVVLGGGTATGSNSIAIGIGGGTATGNNSIAFGSEASTSGEASIAIGYNAKASGVSSIALGEGADASVDYSTAIGHYAIASDIGVTVISATKARNAFGTAFQRTQLYLIGAGSTMSTTYCDGEAGLGFVFEDSDGEIVKRGTIKLSALMTENTDTFEPSDW